MRDKIAVGKEKIAEILGVFQNFLTQPGTILAAKLCAESIGTASESISTQNGEIPHLMDLLCSDKLSAGQLIFSIMAGSRYVFMQDSKQFPFFL